MHALHIPALKYSFARGLSCGKSFNIALIIFQRISSAGQSVLFRTIAASVRNTEYDDLKFMSACRTISQNLFSTSKLKSESRILRSFLKRILIKVLFQNFFYFSGLTVLLVLMRAYFPAER
jgi:hypothetical protein